MDDLISRQAAIDAFGLSEKTRKYGGDHSGYGTMMLYEIQDTLESLPSAEPERKKGKWLLDPPGGDYALYKCSACGKCWMHWWATRMAKYCPHCGADMRGEEDAEVHSS